MTSPLEPRIAALEERVAALEARLSDRSDPRPRTPAFEDEALVGKLRQWRRERAEVEGVKPFHVFGDRVMVDIATTKPADKFELSKIRDFGTNRMERFGDDVLGIVREHLDW